APEGRPSPRPPAGDEARETAAAAGQAVDSERRGGGDQSPGCRAPGAAAGAGIRSTRKKGGLSPPVRRRTPLAHWLFRQKLQSGLGRIELGRARSSRYDHSNRV